MKLMKPRHDKVVASTTLALALVVVASSFPALKRLALEHWYIRQLESAESSRRLEAVGKLAEMRSTRAVLPLLRAMHRTWNSSRHSCWTRPPASWEGNRFREALETIGKAGIPAMVTVLGRGEETVREAAIALESMGAEAESAVPALVEVFRNGRSDCRLFAGKALGAGHGRFQRHLDKRGGGVDLKGIAHG